MKLKPFFPSFHEVMVTLVKILGELETVFFFLIEKQPLIGSTSFPGLFPFELGRREKTLASAGHVPILHPKILGVIN